MTQDINGTLTHTVQSQVQSDLTDNSLSILPFLLQAGEIMPPYWSKARDLALGRFYLKIDHVSSAFSMFISKTASIPVKVIPRDMSIKAHVKQADDLTANINELSDWGGGWAQSLAPKMLLSYITQDNGCTVEVLGDGKPDKERRGFYGLAFLDPSRVQRTSNPIYPIIYWDIGPGGSGNKYKMHHTRVMTAASMPSPNSDLNGVGFCALSRMINTAQHLLDMATTEQEELGSRPKRRIIIGKKGITAQEISTAFQQADMQMDSQGLSRYSKSVVIASTTKPTANNEIELDTIDLASVLKGEDKERSITLGMFLISLALNIPPRWLWPATSTGATKADAMFQHIAGMGGGIGHLLQIFVNMLGGGKLADVLGKPIPSHLEVMFDNQDDEQDRQQAEIREIRAQTRKENLASKVMDIRTARERMLDASDITEQQFDDMELADGRLPDGTDILNLFLTTDPALQEMLSISVGDVLNVKENDAETVLSAIEDKLLEVRAILVNPVRPKIFDQAKQAFGALIALRQLYEDEQARAEMEALRQTQDAAQMMQTASELDEDGKPVEDTQPPPQQEPAAPIEEKELTVMQPPWEIIFKMLESMHPREQQPSINIKADIIVPPVDITLNPNIILPEQKAPNVTVSPTFSPNINLPKQAAPIVHVRAGDIKIPEIKMPPMVKEAPPVIHFNPQINIPKQDAPVINVNPEINIEVPEFEKEVTEVERDSNGFIKRAIKTRKRKE